MATRTKRFLPEEVNNYELAPCNGLFSFVVPEATENLFKNPSYELDTSLWNAFQCTISRSIEKQTRGAFSAKVTCTAGATHAIYYTITLTAGTTYTASVDMWGIPPYFYQIQITGGATLFRNFYPSRKWLRGTFTFVAPTTASYNIAVSTNAPVGTSFYVDGWQLEQKRYATTYCDGDMSGFVPGEVAYTWKGTPHLSSSSRSPFTRSGGREIFLNDLGFKMVGFTGLGMVPVENIIKPLTQGGGFYNGTIPQSRTFSLVGSIFGTSTEELQRKRKAIIDIVRFDSTKYSQEMLVRYRPSDLEPNAEVHDIKCAYVSGLEGNVTSEFQEKLVIQFIQSESYIEMDKTFASYLGKYKYLGAKPIFIRDQNWNLTTLASTISDYAVELMYDRKNNIYAGGYLDTIDGSTFWGIAKWDGYSWNALASGVSKTGGTAPGVVLGMVELPDGRVVIGGDFTSASGVANTNYIACWNPSSSAFTAFGNANGIVTSVIYVDGYIYACGAFTNIGGSAINYLAKTQDGVTFTAVAGGVPAGTNSVSELDTLVINNSINLYVMYTNTSPTLRNLIAVITVNAVSPSWTTLYTSATKSAHYSSMSASVYDNCIYVAAVGVDAFGYYDNSFLRIKGSSVETLISSQNVTGIGLFGIEALSDGPVAVGINADLIDLSSTPYATYNFANSYFGYRDYKQFYQGDTISSTYTNAFGQHRTIPPEVVMASTGHSYCTLSTVNNGGDAITSPKITLMGPCNLYVMRFHQSAKFIHYKNFVVDYNETVTFNFDTPTVTITSNTKGDVTGKIARGYFDNIKFGRGDNEISIIYTGFYNIDTTNSWEHQILGATYENTDNGKLYITWVSTGGVNGYFDYYKDAGKTQLVARSGTAGFGAGVDNRPANVAQMNSSGIAGLVFASNTSTTNGTIAVPIFIATWKERRLVLDGI